MLGISRQAVYQSEKRKVSRAKVLSQVKSLVLDIRRDMPRVGTRKLYYLLKPEFDKLGIKIGRDAYSRKIVGYKLSDDMSAEQVVRAFNMAVENRNSKKELIHHSDRGLQYCASLYQKALKKHNVRPSMTDGYDCYRNALAERVNGILKQEFLIHKCNNGKELEQLIKESIDTYNNKRPHLSLNMKTPNFIHNKKTFEACFKGLI